jgi:putative DNA primase/helicase
LSPVSVFVREHCEVGPVCEVSRADLYERFQKWAERHGRVRVSDEAGFGRDLRAALPGLKTAQRRLGAHRARYYVGVALRQGDAFEGD